MTVDRTLEILTLIAESGVLKNADLAELERDHPELAEVEFNLSTKITSRPIEAYITGPPEDCYPAENGEYEQDMMPEDVACMFTKIIVAALPDRLVLPTIIEGIWLEICNAEKYWQDNNLDEKVWSDYHDADC